ncbi:MAG: imidazole glycerol phosphate synthase subunit HisF [Leptonema sp. (in: Bacteria)]|nr:imidazole glycerol phosphate synthase subunit HisF [Leptonema sp. (in: bacteria)]
MVAVRVIPCLDIKDGRVVKGVNFVDLKDAGDPVQNAIFYAEQGADELTFLDITATTDKRDIVRNLVKEVADHIFIPFAVGGGIRTIQDIDNVLMAGADKVSINTAGFDNPSLFTQAARKFGSQCIVAAIDARFNGNIYEVLTQGGRHATGRSVTDWAKEAVERGAGEILLTSMDRDGTKGGYDISMTRAVVDSVSVPVIASGGAGEPAHFVDACLKGGAQGALAASIFHFREYSIADVKKKMQDAGLRVRWNYTRQGLEQVYKKAKSNQTNLDFLHELQQLLIQRKAELPEGSYTAKLFREGEDRYLKKIVEEAGETVIAAKNHDKAEIIYETADLIFHTLLMLVDQNISLNDIVVELRRRHSQ